MGGGPFSMESRQLLRLLADGKWYDLEEVIVRLAATVAPGKALRKYEQHAAQRATTRGPRKGPEPSDGEKIASGQRMLATAAIHSMKRRFVEVAEAANGRQIRRRPGMDVYLPPKLDTGDGDRVELMPGEAFDGAGGSSLDAAEPAEGSSEVCPRCGLYVANQAQHVEFHALHDAGEGVPAAVAFFSEDQVRGIVADEVEKALDAFQKGMQSWLIHRFAAMETLIQGRMKNPLGLERQPSRSGW